MHACACCDGHTRIEPVGWSSQGDKLLVEIEQVAACEPSRYLSVLSVGKIVGEECYDLAVAPNKRIQCSEVSSYPAWEKKPKKSMVVSRFRHAAVALSPSQVRARSSFPGGDGSVRTTIVEVYWQSKWRQMWRGQLGVGIGIGGGEEPKVPPHIVKIFPSPKGRRAVLFIANHYIRDNNGHLDTHLSWIELPHGFKTRKRNHSGKRSILDVPVPDWDQRKEADRKSSQEANASGLKLHRSRKFVQATEMFISALKSDPANAMARYNLACSLNLLGLQARALGQLQQIAAAKCPKCSARLKRATQDEDLASLWSHPLFRSMARAVAR